MNIIYTSETPQLALDVIEKELKIRPLLRHQNLQEEIPEYAKEFVIDVTFATFGLM